MKYFLSGLLAACALAAQPAPGTGVIAGHVLNSLTNASIRNASVVLSAIAMPIRLVADTDAEGSFQFSGLPPGAYKLSASRAGFLDRSARRPISLAPDAKVTGAAVRLPPQAVIAGRILDEEGDPVAHAQVAIFKQVYRSGSRQWERLNLGNLTTDTGEYRFANLTAGRYLVRALSQRPTANNRYGGLQEQPVMDYVPEYYPNAPSEAEALPLDLAAGAELRGLDIHLFKRPRPARFRVRGKISGVQGSPRILVSLLPNNWGNTMAVPPDYAFELEAAPGHYGIFASVHSDGPEAYGTGSVTVSENVSNVSVTMSPPPDVTGRITVVGDGRDVKLQGVQVLLTRIPAYLNPLSVQSDAAGRFTVPKPLPPGHYSLRVAAHTIPDGCFVQTVKFAGQEVSPDDFEIRGSAQLDIVLSNTAGRITGSVTDDEGKFPYATVTLIPTSGTSPPVKQAADEDGNFKFTGVKPGKYQLFAWEEVDDGLWEDPSFRKSYESQAAEVTVGPSETQTTQLRLIPTP
jgi:uncharacterized protein (DUF2141 family)